MHEAVIYSNKHAIKALIGLDLNVLQCDGVSETVEAIYTRHAGETNMESVELPGFKWYQLCIKLEIGRIYKLQTNFLCHIYTKKDPAFEI